MYDIGALTFQGVFIVDLFSLFDIRVTGQHLLSKCKCELELGMSMIDRKTEPTNQPKPVGQRKRGFSQCRFGNVPNQEISKNISCC